MDYYQVCKLIWSKYGYETLSILKGWALFLKHCQSSLGLQKSDKKRG